MIASAGGGTWEVKTMLDLLVFMKVVWRKEQVIPAISIFNDLAEARRHTQQNSYQQVIPVLDMRIRGFIALEHSIHCKRPR